MRPPKACLLCRSRKQKCEIKGLNATSCTYCQYRSSDCSLFINPRPVGYSVQSSSTSSVVARIPRVLRSQDGTIALSGGLKMPPDEVCVDLISIYFTTLHDTDHVLFHRPTFLRDFEQRKVPQLILLSILALAARFSNHPYFERLDRGARGQEWSIAAKSMFHIQAMEASIVTLQSCRLIGCLSQAEGDAATEAICSAIANRVLQLLGLPYRLSEAPVKREQEIRVFWSIYMMDIWSSTGNRIPRTFTLDSSWPWPMEESAFDQLDTSHHLHDAEILDNNHPLRQFSLWGLMIPLSHLKGQIHDLNDRFRETSDGSDTKLLELVFDLSSNLDHWVSSLPSHMLDTPENIASFAQRGFCRSFIALHIGYHYHAILLYFRFLYISFQLELSTPAALYAQRCKFHATAISEDLWTAYKEHDNECAWPLVSHLLVISSSVHLHTLLLDRDNELVSRARSLLQQNFLLLMRLNTAWPWLVNSMTRLRAFHEACHRTLKTEDAFRMDDWMMKFLHEHSENVVDDRPECDPQLFNFDSW